MVTIKDIAKKTGVSYTTVSRALNGKAGVNQSTRELILLEAKKMGYQPNGIARGLVNKFTNTIGLIIPDITNPFFPAIARGVEDEASKHGYNVFLCNTNWDKGKEQTYLAALLEKRVDGIIVKPAEDDEQVGVNIKVPMVLINTRIYKGNECYIDVDNEKGGFLATKHLIECGYTRIAFIGGKPKSFSNEDRLEGYKKALKAFNIAFDESIKATGDYTVQSGYEQMQKLLNCSYPPDAVFAVNDLIALGAMSCAQDLGFTIPKDIGIVGFDNIQLSELPQVQLTTVAQPIYDMGRIAFNHLFAQIKEKESYSCAKAVLEPELIIRKTTVNKCFK